jgi:hypothetical protein
MAIVKGLGMKQIVLNASQSLGFWDCSQKTQMPSSCQAFRIKANNLECLAGHLAFGIIAKSPKHLVTTKHLGS